MSTAKLTESGGESRREIELLNSNKSGRALLNIRNVSPECLRYFFYLFARLF